MNTKSIVAIAAIALASGAVFAQEADPAGQFAQTVASTQSRADVNAQLAQYRAAGVNPWSISYNPLKSFASQKTSEQVRAEYLADRAEVAAMTSEDSGSAYLAQAHIVRAVGTNLAGTPVNPQ